MFISVAFMTVVIICVVVAPIVMIIQDVRGRLRSTYFEILPYLLAVSAGIIFIEGFFYIS